MRVIIVGSALGMLLAGSAAVAQSPARDALLVLSKGDHTLAIVDPSSLKVLGKVPVGEDPHEVIASSDGKLAYVSNYGGGAYHTLANIDLSSQSALTPINLGALRGPHGLDFVAGKVWFTAEAAKAIGSYDPATKEIDWIMGTGQDGTHMISVSQDLKQIITTNIRSATVTLMEMMNTNRPSPPSAPNGASEGSALQRRTPVGPPGGNWKETLIPVGRGAEGFDISPDKRELWTANATDGTVSVIDLNAKKVTETIQANVTGANRLKFTPDGKLVLISCLRDEDLTILDAATHKLVKRVKIGHGAAGIQIQPDGVRAFIACTPDNYVVALDLKSLEVSTHFDVGPQPDGMAWARRQ